MIFIQSGLGNRATLGHPPCQALEAPFHSVAGFIASIALHLYLPPDVDLCLYLVIVQLLAMYLHMTLARPVDCVALRHNLGSHCLEILGRCQNHPHLIHWNFLLLLTCKLGSHNTVFPGYPHLDRGSMDAGSSSVSSISKKQSLNHNLH